MRSIENDQFVFYELDPRLGKGRELARTGLSPSITGDWELWPDGLFIAIPNHDPQNAKIRVISLDATEPDRAERVVTPDGMRNLMGVAWGAGGEWYVTEKKPLEVALFYVDREGHSWELLTSPTTLFAVPSLNGLKIAFPQNITSSNVWLINGF